MRIYPNDIIRNLIPHANPHHIPLNQPATKGKLSKVAHFDSKAHVEDYIRSIDLPASFYMPGFYMSNIPGGMMRQDPSGKWTFALPIPGDTSAIPLVDIAEDTGKFVKAILMNRDSTLGKNIYGAVDYYSPDRMVEEFKKVYPEAGATASFAQLPPDVFKGILGKSGMPEQAQEELLENMLLLGKDFGYYGGASLTESHKVSVGSIRLMIWKDGLTIIMLPDPRRTPYIVDRVHQDCTRFQGSQVRREMICNSRSEGWNL